MKKTILLILTACTQLFFLTESIFAQTGIVEGHVKGGAAGDPVNGITIYLYSHDFQPAIYTTTDGTGYYTFGAIPSGTTYTVSLGVEVGAPVGSYRIIAVTSGTNTVNFWIDAVTDADGNKYSAVEIGTHVWMGENLRTATFRGGNPILPYIENPPMDGWNELTTPGYSWYDNYEPEPIYGALYNWYTVNYNICPLGWHVPSTQEWTSLTDYLGGVSVADDKLKEAGSSHWTTNQTSTTNETGFSALPGGWLEGIGIPNYGGSHGAWWTSTWYELEQQAGIIHIWEEGAPTWARFPTDGLSIRCMLGAAVPILTTAPVSEITYQSAISGGNITSDGGAAIQYRGVCWSISQNPTIGAPGTSYMPSGDLTDSFTSYLPLASQNTTYYVRAFAINSAGTGYGNEVSFKTTCEGSVFSYVVEDVTCNGGNDGVIAVSVVAGGTLPFAFEWTGPGGFTASGSLLESLAAGQYNLTATDAVGCVETRSYTVSQPPLLSFTSASVTSPILCNGGTASVTIQASGGTTPISYTFNGETNTTGVFTGVTAGDDLPFSIDDAKNCGPITGTIDIVQPTVLSFIGASVTGPILCNGETATVTIQASGGTAPISYTFNGETNTTGVFSGVLAGNYLPYSISDLNNCGPITGTIDVLQPASLSAKFATTNVTCHSCDDATINLAVSGGTPGSGYTYAWTGPDGYSSTSQYISALKPGSYTVLVTDANVCSETFYVELINPFIVTKTDDEIIGSLNYQYVSEIGLGTNPRDVALSFNGSTAYVTNTTDNTVSVITNLDTDDPVNNPPSEQFPRITMGEIPMKIKINPLGTLAYITNYNSNNVYVIDLTEENGTKNEVIATIDVGANPYGIVVDPENKWAFVANHSSNDVSVIDVDPNSGGFNQVVSTIATGTSNVDLDITSNGEMLLVAGNDGLKIFYGLVWSGSDFEYSEINAISGTRTTDVTVTPDAETAIVITSEGDILLVDIEPGSENFGTVIASYDPTPLPPIFVGNGKISPDGQYYYLTNPDDDQITVYRLNYEGGGLSLEEYTTIHVGDTPVDLAIDPENNKIVVVNSGNEAQNGSVGLITLNGIDDEIGSLRYAITYANEQNTATPDLITFNIPGNGPFKIQPNTELPEIIAPLVIDGYSQPDATLKNLLIELDGTNAGSGSNGIPIHSSNCTVKGLIINRFSGNGIQITSGTGNTISGNSIYENGERGIDLGGDGAVTANDLGDVDVGPNGFQNFPVLESLTFSPGQVNISGSLDGKPDQTYTLQFFSSKVPDNTGYGEGQTYLGSLPLTVIEYGNTAFTESFPINPLDGDVITATTTDPDGNTSEFSAAIGGLQNQVIENSNLPIQYNINNEPVKLIDFSDIAEAVNLAFNTWSVISTTTSHITFDYVGGELGTTSKYASATDGVNLVSFHDDLFPFTPGVLAVCAKTLKIEADAEEAKIMDADIVFNPSFVNDPTLDFGIFGSSYPGFFDIQSVTTHEIGHILGLIHSGVYNSVMWFEIGQGIEFRNLKQDDISWLSYRYPDADGNFDATYGSISGNITYGYNDNPAVPIPVAGAIVLAINDENKPLVHAYSDADGNYLIPGLPPGSYRVFITPLDGDVYGRPLWPGNISAYIYCNTIYTDYPGEYFNTNDLAEEDRLFSTPILVSSTDKNITGINLITNIDKTPPTIKTVSPENGSSNVSVLPNIIITFSEPVDMTTLTDHCYLTEAGSSTQIGGNYQPEGSDDNSDIVLFTPLYTPPENSLKFGTTYTLHVTHSVTDLRGNLLEVDDPATSEEETEYTSTFTTLIKDNEAPNILSIQPVDNEANVFLDKEILVTFSEPMIRSSVEASFSLTWNEAGGVNNVICMPSWYEYSALTLTPENPLSEGVTYKLNWTAGATDLAGNKLKAGSISFTTIPNAVPSINYMEPGTDLNTNVAVETAIVVDFSEPMDITSINSNTFSLASGVNPISGSFEFLKENSRIVFRPSTYLEFSTDYSITLTSGIHDVSQEIGNFAGLTTTFTTASEPTKPHISSIRPMSGVATLQVKINGYGFDPDPDNNTVTFNSGVEAVVTNASLTSLTVVVPYGAISGPIVVSVNGTLDDQDPKSYITFFYIIPPSDPSYEAYANTNTGSQSRGGTVDYSGATAYITNSGENTVSVVENLDSNPKEVMPRIQVGTTPMMIALNPLGTLAYVTNFNSHNVSVIDLTEGTTKYNVIEKIDVGAYPYGISASGNNIYVANSECVSVINIDPVSGGFDHVVANINTGTRNRDLAMDPNGGILVVTGDNGLNIIELIQSGLGFDYAVTNVNPGTTTRNVSVTHDGGTAVVTTEDGNIFMVGIVRGTSYFGNAYYNYNPKAKAGDGTTSYDGQYYYVTNPDNNQVTVYELLYEEGGGGYDESSFPRRRALKELMTIPTGERPEGIFNDHDDDKFGTANFDGDNITLIAKRTGDEKVVTDLIKDLFVAVDGLKNTEGFKDALANELLIKINDALKNINNKKTKTAINMLKAFINKVKALDKAGEFPPDDPDIAVYLIATAQRIIDLLGGKSETEESTEASFDQSQPDLISVSKLGEIFPNPFSQTVKINYEIAESVGSPEKVFIRIYDISGRLVGTLVNETMPSGRYSTLWSGKYEKGGPAPLGSYFIRFSAGKTNEVKQIMLIR